MNEPATGWHSQGCARRWTRILLALIYAVAGVLHLAAPAPFLAIMPPGVPRGELVVFITGIAEMAGAAGLAQQRWPSLQRAAGWGLASYALAVWPANVQHLMLDLARPDQGLGWAYHGPRMLLQPLLIWAALWCSGALRTSRTL